MTVYSGTVTTSYHGTLTAGSVDTVNFTTGFHSVAVYNHSATAIYFKPSTLGTAAPTAGGDTTYVVPASTTTPFIWQGKDQATYVKVVGAAASVYSVEGLR